MSLRVFIIDDHEVVRAAIARLMEDWGADVCGQAPSAAEALEKLSVIVPDVVILDNLMRGTTGLEAIPKIKEIAPGVKIVFLTMDKAAAEEAREAGADACADKANVAELHDAIAKISSKGSETERTGS